ncbi:MAG: ComF family protein [Vicinamibacteria bacterium]
MGVRGSSILRALGSGLQGLGAVLFPSLCLVCQDPLHLPLEGPLCRSCLDRLPRIEDPFCPRCGLPYPPGVEPGLCGPCRRAPRYFRRARAHAPYVEEVRLCLHALKYGGRRRIASVLGRQAARFCVGAGELRGVSAVVPVPLSRGRRRERGFNQAEIIARAVARRARLPLRCRVLRKTSERPPQAGLSAAARRKNVASAYRATLPPALRGASLLLVDDVLTTGATAEAAARALLLAGAGAVDVLTIARVP